MTNTQQGFITSSNRKLRAWVESVPGEGIYIECGDSSAYVDSMADAVRWLDYKASVESDEREALRALFA